MWKLTAMITTDESYRGHGGPVATYTHHLTWTLGTEMECEAEAVKQAYAMFKNGCIVSNYQHQITAIPPSRILGIEFSYTKVNIDEKVPQDWKY